jgi:TolA-binding protein
MTNHRHRRLFRTITLMVSICSTPLFAQQPASPSASTTTASSTASDDRTRELERKLDELLRQAAELRHEIDQMKGQTPSGTASPAAAVADSDDLTKVDVVDAPAPGGNMPQTATGTSPAAVSNATQDQPPALTDAREINNGSNPGASKVFNPDISVIANFLGHAGDTNPFENRALGLTSGNVPYLAPADPRAAMQLDEAEVAFEAFVDPYAKAKIFLSVTPEGIEVEEGYANFVSLPFDLTAKVGRMKATFGKANTWHTHVRPWVDQPLVIHNFFGDGQLADSGISVSKSFAAPSSIFLEATGEVFSGHVDNVFEHRNQNDLFYNAHLKAFRDISENSNVEIGGSWARGTLASNASLTGDPAGANQFAGIDVTYRWKPLVKATYQSFIARFEAIQNRRDDLSDHLNGFYASADYQFAQRWFTGVRVDQADRALAFDSNGAATVLFPGRIWTDRGASATLSFWPSEFSQLRAQLRHTSYGGEKSVNELLLQLQFAIGAHGAHTF